jgi:heterodisulfide reductase subunit A-like polyferredoxin
MKEESSFAGSEKIGFIFCVCTGKCSGFAKLDIWDFINIVRSELPVEYAFVHPMLCDEDGERFLNDFLRPGRKYVVAGCAPVMQNKLFRDAFQKAGLDINKDLISLDARDKTVEEALNVVKDALRKSGKNV